MAVLPDDEDEGEETGYRIFSYRSHVQRIIKKYFEASPSQADQECLPLLYTLLGNNYLQSLNYEKAIEAYEKAISLSVEPNALLYFLISQSYLQWCTCRTNFEKSKTILMAFKYLQVSYKLGFLSNCYFIS